ncbi:hypothetical protein NL64_06105 [Pseudomonas fluorescens]|uniref:hypothetical protein n=1 Tax=Pseudomonas fluorescens TaxID=294 RepID=UPI00054B6DBC|nr:hypothetical protein [Pseudomonas fluorescens]KII34836.1 hypothetical protein NL64_06105 [Pseudomonas fluorescens]
MSVMGLRIWDKDGKLIFSETDFTMRVLGKVQIRLGNRSGVVRVATPLAKPGVHAMVNVLPGSYTQWGTYSGYKNGVRASLPTVTVGDGELILSASSGSSYRANIDVIMVGSA